MSTTTYPVSAWEEAYRKHFPSLCRIVVDRFELQSTDAEAVVQDVFVSYGLHAPSVRSPEGWLVSATFDASRNFLRAKRRLEPPPHDIEQSPDPTSGPEPLQRRLRVGQILDRLGDATARLSACTISTE